MVELIIQPKCIGCLKIPEEIEEYIWAAQDEDMTPSEYVKREEGTYNPTNGHFTCTRCYFGLGSPTTIDGWKAP